MAKTGASHFLLSLLNHKIRFDTLVFEKSQKDSRNSQKSKFDIAAYAEKFSTKF